MPNIISTSTSATATAPFNQRKIDRNQDGTLWSARIATVSDGQGGTTPGAVFAYSKDNGATWTSLALDGRTTAGTASAISGAADISLFIDLDDYAHIAFNQGLYNAVAADTGGARINGPVYYMRGTPNAGRTGWTWSAAVAFDSAANFDNPDIVAHREGAGWSAHIVAPFIESQSNLVSYVRMSITSAGAISATPQANISNNYQVGGANCYPSIDFNHTGDGKTVAGGTPHLYVGWTTGSTGAGQGIRFRKAVYAAGAWTWNAEREIDNTVKASFTDSWQSVLFDGTRITIAGSYGNASNAGAFRQLERDAADTATTVISTTFIPLASGSATYDSAGNVYLLGRDSSGVNGTRLLNYRKWTRATATLGPIVTFDTTGNDFPYVSAKRGYSSNSIDWVYTDGTASPYSVTFERIALTPLTPYTPAVML